VVLLPAWSNLAQSQWRRDCLLAKNADDEALSESYARLIQAIPSEAVLARRLARRRFGFIPRNEYVVSSNPPELVPARHTALPARPSGLLIAIAETISLPTVRTIVLMVAALLCVWAVISARQERNKPRLQGPLEIDGRS
ncbi:MAG: hypothetical protein J7M14_01440, partial [Planctomycetes bacterium]|nr:hypothetical protein [Planctomycetota bacterium]